MFPVTSCLDLPKMRCFSVKTWKVPGNWMVNASTKISGKESTGAKPLKADCLSFACVD